MRAAFPLVRLAKRSSVSRPVFTPSLNRSGSSVSVPGMPGIHRIERRGAKLHGASEWTVIGAGVGHVAALDARSTTPPRHAAPSSSA